MPEIISSPKVYDAVIVGSGAGGGMAAYVLTQAGAKCLMLEAGDWWDTAKQSTMFQWPYEAPHRGARDAGEAQWLFRPRLRRVAHSGRALHQRPRQRLVMVADARPGRTHEPLGTHLAAHGSLRLQALLARWERASTGRSAMKTLLLITIRRKN